MFFLLVDRLQSFAKHPYWISNLISMLRPARSCMCWRVCLNLSLHRLRVWPRWCWPIPDILFACVCLCCKDSTERPNRGSKGVQEHWENLLEGQKLNGKMCSSGINRWSPAAGVYLHGPLRSSNNSSRISDFFHDRGNIRSQKKWGKMAAKTPLQMRIKNWVFIWRIVSLSETLLKSLTLLCLHHWSEKLVIFLSLKFWEFLLLAGLHVKWCSLTKQ